MTDKILCVDDDEHVLSGYQRQLRKQFQIMTASGGEAGLRLISSESFAVVVSDLRMPVMDGIEFLAKVKQAAPDTVRMMLTGNADLQAAIDAVNQGNIFRFLTKPCPGEIMAQALQAGLHQYHLVTAEKELLEKTLKGSIGVLTEILSILDPQSFGRACAMRDSVQAMAEALNVPDTWDLELAGMLFEIGRVTVPASIIVKERAGALLSGPEHDVLMRVPEIGHQLLEKIPRLEPVAQSVLYQKKNYNGSGLPLDHIAGKQIPLGSRIIRVLSDLYQLESSGKKREAAFAILKYQDGIYDPDILDCAYRCLVGQPDESRSTTRAIRSISVAELEIGQVLITDIVTGSGMLLVSAGNKITGSLRERIRNFGRLQSIREPIKVEIAGD